MPTISVIVPVYKVEKYIHRCVDSILGQTYADFELILVDDGSPDNCGAICDEYAAKDSRVVVIHQKNGGLSSARNAGIDIATGAYISFVDSDDYIYPNYLERLYEVLVEFDADISVCKMIEFSNDIPQLRESNSVPKAYHNIEICNMLCDYRKAIGIVEACGKLYKKKLFEYIRFPVGRLHEDQFVSHRIMYAAEKTAITEAQLYGYFYNPVGITKQFSVKRYDNVIALKEARKFYLDNSERELADKAEKLMRVVISFYAIAARRNGVYGDVPQEYKMGAASAFREIRQQLGYDYYEWYLFQQAPFLAKIQAKFRTVYKYLLDSNKE